MYLSNKASKETVGENNDGHPIFSVVFRWLCLMILNCRQQGEKQLNCQREVTILLTNRQRAAGFPPLYGAVKLWLVTQGRGDKTGMVRFAFKRNHSQVLTIKMQK